MTFCSFLATISMSEIKLPCRVTHGVYGDGLLVRIEGVVWVVSFGQWLFRFRPSQRANLTLHDKNKKTGEFDITDPNDEAISSDTPMAIAGIHEVYADDNNKLSNLNSGKCDLDQLASFDARTLRKAIKSISTGLSPRETGIAQWLAVGFDECNETLTNFLERTSFLGAALIIRAPYGCGKTFTLLSAETLALKNNFAFAQCEIDNSEIRLDKANQVYSALMRKMKFPDGGEGIGHLLELVRKWLSESKAPSDPLMLFRWLEKKLQCEQISWMLADRELSNKPTLVKAFSGAPISSSLIRQQHILGNHPPGWIYFKYGTQGDLGSFLLSGISRLMKNIGFSGLILALDEMERWQDLNWQNQERAGNLLGGLIWSASASPGVRQCLYNFRWFCNHSSRMCHSNYRRGSQFTTADPCNLGVVIAMTPRGLISPELVWQEYGELSVMDLPKYSAESFRAYFEKVKYIYKLAYDINVPEECVRSSEKVWRMSGDLSPRSAGIAIIEKIEEWRNQ
jgi:hypothetical protein